MKKLLATAFAVCAILGTAALQAHPEDDDGPGMHEPGHPPGQMDHARFERMARELQLTADQRKQADQIHQKYDALRKTQFDLMGPLHDQLKTLLAAETVDLAAVRAKIEEIGRIHVELRMVQIQEHLEFQTILTPAQKTKFQDMMRQRMEHRPGPGPGPRPNPNNRPNNNRPNQPHH